MKYKLALDSKMKDLLIRLLISKVLNQFKPILINKDYQTKQLSL